MSWGAMEEEWRKGPWTAEEDRLLIEYVQLHGEGRWNSVARLTGLRRNGKSCRLRWVNYLRPDLKRGQITPHEENIIIELHARWGNRWSTIARSLPGRTDNEIKNYWRTHFKKKTAKTKNEEDEDGRKTKTRRLRRQQQYEQQQQQQQHQYEQQNQQLVYKVDMKGIMSLLEEDDSKVPSVPPQHDMAPIYNNAAEEQGEYLRYGSVPEASSTEDIFWDDGLWDLDDVYGNLRI